MARCGCTGGTGCGCVFADSDTVTRTGVGTTGSPFRFHAAGGGGASGPLAMVVDFRAMPNGAVEETNGDGRDDPGSVLDIGGFIGGQAGLVVDGVLRSRPEDAASDTEASVGYAFTGVGRPADGERFTINLGRLTRETPADDPDDLALVMLTVTDIGSNGYSLGLQYGALDGDDDAVTIRASLSTIDGGLPDVELWTSGALFTGNKQGARWSLDIKADGTIKVLRDDVELASVTDTTTAYNTLQGGGLIVGQNTVSGDPLVGCYVPVRWVALSSTDVPVLTLGVPGAGGGAPSSVSDIVLVTALPSVPSFVMDSFYVFAVPPSLEGKNVTDVNLACAVPGATGGGSTVVQVQRLRSGTTDDVTSTSASLPEDELATLPGGAGAVIDGANDDLAAGDLLIFNCTAVNSIVPATGLQVILSVA